MVFSSPSFLFYFLPAVLFTYIIAGFLRIGYADTKLLNAVLLFFSLVFYVYGSGIHILLVLAITFSSYLFGLFRPVARRVKPLLAISISFPIALLIVFKYANFLTFQAASLADIMNLPGISATNIILPVGISFYTFQCLSYVIDVHQEKEKPEKNFLYLLLYISMFPQLIAGPIVRYNGIYEKLHCRKINIEDFASGISRFIYGLSKKVIVADACGIVCDTAYSISNDDITASVAYIGSVAYFFQIYFDFSAYSDMAIGLGRILGFDYPENFRRPYSSSSVTEFWRRWHMTLSFWFRDYLYFSMGGSRKGSFRTYINLWTVFLFTGLWHGASWTFVFWGGYHGALLSLERFFNLRDHTRFLAFWRTVTLIFIYLGWVAFRAESFDQATVFYFNIFYPSDWDLVEPLCNILTHKNVAFILLGSASLFFSKDFVLGQYIEKMECRKVEFVFKAIFLTSLAVYSTFLIASKNYSPFIYFQF